MSKIVSIHGSDIKVGDTIITVRTYPTNDDGVVTLIEKGKVYRVEGPNIGRHLSHFALLDVSFLVGGDVSLAENLGPKHNDRYGSFADYDQLFKVED